MNLGTSRIFRRASNPMMVPATDVPSQYSVTGIPPGATTFCAVNSYPIWIRLKGTADGTPFSACHDGEGWLFPPGHFGVYATQYPRWMSAVAVDRPGFPIKDPNGALLYPNAALEVSYGSGA